MRDEDVLEFAPFDHMVVRFIYTRPDDGRDLDIMVYLNNTGTVYDGDAVGYNQLPNAFKVPSNSTLDADAYLWWADDDTGVGNGTNVEGVVLGLDNFVTNEIIVGNEVQVHLRTGWFNNRGTGDVTVELQTYLGGTMSKVGTNIVNTGGTLVGTQSKLVNVVTAPTPEVNQISGAHSDLVGVVTYNKITKQATLI